MQSLINSIITFVMALGLTTATFEFYRAMKKEALLKVYHGTSRLSPFTQKMTGGKHE